MGEDDDGAFFTSVTLLVLALQIETWVMLAVAFLINIFAVVLFANFYGQVSMVDAFPCPGRHFQMSSYLFEIIHFHP